MALRSDLLSWASVTQLFHRGKEEGAELFSVMPSITDSDDAVVSFHSAKLGHLWKEPLGRKGFEGRDCPLVGPSSLIYDPLLSLPLMHGWVILCNIIPPVFFFSTFSFSSPLLFPFQADSHLSGSRWQCKNQK